jgi:1-acyl-sn-glycerol-3-phosphate acyltransferase
MAAAIILIDRLLHLLVNIMPLDSGQSPPRRSRPSLALTLFRPLGWLWLKASGWQVEGEMPDLPKFVIVAAPHRTNWDLPYTLAAGLHYGLRIRWMGKDSLFKWPYNGFMRWLGGIPVDRSKRNNAVAQVVEMFDASPELIVVIPPEGTRSEVARWKSGFYHIAHGAKVPLVLGFIDYRRKRVGVAGIFHPTGDYDADLARIQAVYAPMTDPVPAAA